MTKIKMCKVQLSLLWPHWYQYELKCLLYNITALIGYKNMQKRNEYFHLEKIHPVACSYRKWQVKNTGQENCEKNSEAQFNENGNTFLLSDPHSFSIANSLLYSQQTF